MPDDSTLPPAQPPRARRTYLQRPFDERLAIAEGVGAAYATNAELKAALATVGVTDAMVDDLRDALGPVRAAVAAQTRAYVAARAASDAQDAVLAAAEAAHADPATRTQAAFRTDIATRRALGVDRKATRQQARLAQMQQLYAGAAEHTAHLATYGVTPAMLDAGRTALGAAEAAVQLADQRAAEAQHATAQRDAAMAPADALVRDLQERAKAALRDRPQLLELLGLRPR